MKRVLLSAKESDETSNGSRPVPLEKDAAHIFWFNAAPMASRTGTKPSLTVPASSQTLSRNMPRFAAGLPAQVDLATAPLPQAGNLDVN